MPTIYRERGHAYVIYSQDHPPPHVHVKHAGCEAKVFLDPVAVERHFGFTQQELSRIKDVVRAHAHEFAGSWHGIFGDPEG